MTTTRTPAEQYARDIEAWKAEAKRNRAACRRALRKIDFSSPMTLAELRLTPEYTAWSNHNAVLEQTKIELENLRRCLADALKHT